MFEAAIERGKRKNKTHEWCEVFHKYRKKLNIYSTNKKSFEKNLLWKSTKHSEESVTHDEMASTD